MKKQILFTLIFFLGLFLMPNMVRASFSDFCMYKDPSNSDRMIGVDHNHNVYLFDFSAGSDPEPKDFANAVHTDFSDEIKDTDAYRAGSSFSRAGSCPRNLAYITTNTGDVYFHPFADEVFQIIDERKGPLGDDYEKSDDSRIIATEFPWAGDLITIQKGRCFMGVIPTHYSVSGKTFSEAKTYCLDNVATGGGGPLFSMVNYTKDFSWNNYSVLTKEEVGELADEQANQERHEAMEDLVNCWQTNHRAEYDHCFDVHSEGEDFSVVIDCVRNRVEAGGGEYLCGQEESDYESALQRLDDIRAAARVEMELTRLTCEQLLGETQSELRGFIRYAFYMIVAIGLILLIVLTSLDYAKVVSSGGEDSDMLKKANSKVLRRIGIFALLALLPAIILAVFTIFDDPLGIYENCMEQIFFE